MPILKVVILTEILLLAVIVLALAWWWIKIVIRYWLLARLAAKMRAMSDRIEDALDRLEALTRDAESSVADAKELCRRLAQP